MLIIGVGLLFSVARLLLPEVGKYHNEVAAWVGDALGQPVKIGALAAGWHGLGPSVDLRDVTVLDAAGRQAVLQCASARIDINLWESLRRWQFEPGQLTVSGLHLVVVRRADGGIGVMGLATMPNKPPEMFRTGARSNNGCSISSGWPSRTAHWSGAI